MTEKRRPAAPASKNKSSEKPQPRPVPSGRVLSSKISSTSPSPKQGQAVSKPPRAPQLSQTPVPSSISPSSDVAARMAAVQTNWERVAGGAALASLLDDLEEVSTHLDGLNSNLANIRARGYRFGRDWETQMETLNNRWPEQHTQAMLLLENERRVLQESASDVGMLLQRATRNASLIGTAESRVTALQTSINAAGRRVRATFDGTQQQATALQEELDKAQSLLDALDGASFDLLPDEHGIAVCEAVWTTDQATPEGYLFLTDARLIFEQRQEIVKKKVLFIATEKELVQEKLWESPIGAVEEIEAEDKKSFLRRQELLTLRFSERTQETPSDVTLQLKDTDNDTWRTLISRAKSGQIDNERFGAQAPEQQLAATIEEETTAPAKELPTVCPSCAAPLPAIFKGMNQVVCDYCGATINI